MGTWGASIYDDDEACDLRDTVSLICKVPVKGNQLLELLKETCGDCDPMDEEGGLFWLVVAEQFERRGIECREAASKALSIIESDLDLKWAKEKGADEAFLRKRSLALKELAKRLKSPRSFRPRVPPRNPPPLVLTTGEVYAFPMMNRCAWHPYRLPQDGPFEPDGWGALVVLATGRGFNWLPWVAIASLAVRDDRRPSFNEALKARLIFHPQTSGAGRFIPKPNHARGLRLELLGRVSLNTRCVKPLLSKWSVTKAIQYDWTIAYAAIGEAGNEVHDCELSALVRSKD